MNKEDKLSKPKYSHEEIQVCVHILEDLVKHSVELAYLPEDQRIALLTAAGQISRPDKEEIRKRKRDSASGLCPRGLGACAPEKHMPLSPIKLDSFKSNHLCKTVIAFF